MVTPGMRVPHIHRRVSAFLDDIEVPAFFLAPLLALLLASAMFLPNQFARTSWSFKGMGMIDSPAGYVGVLSLWGCIACVALLIGFLWRRRGWIAMMAAAGGFAGAAVVCIGYWQQLERGINLVDGRSQVSEKWMTHYPPALPLFICAAMVGFVSALALARGCWHVRFQE